MAKRKKAVIATAVDPSMKETFKQWWQANNYASESEAMRVFIREKCEEQEQKEQGSKK